MSITMALLLAAAAWVAIGLGLSVAMGRRGHDPFEWWLLGTLLGPLALLLASPEAARRHRQPVSPFHADGHGAVDVLVGLDGSAPAEAALVAALDLLGARVGRVALAAVLHLDDSPQRRLERTAARERLERAAAQVTRNHPGITPGLVIVSGRPADELERLAIEDGYGLLVVGPRGTGLATMVLGSTATELAARGRVPVLVAGGEPATKARSGAAGQGTSSDG